MEKTRKIKIIIRTITGYIRIELNLKSMITLVEKLVMGTAAYRDPAPC